MTIQIELYEIQVKKKNALLMDLYILKNNNSSCWKDDQLWISTIDMMQQYYSIKTMRLYIDNKFGTICSL